MYINLCDKLIDKVLLTFHTSSVVKASFGGSVCGNGICKINSRTDLRSVSDKLTPRWGKQPLIIILRTFKEIIPCTGRWHVTLASLHHWKWHISWDWSRIQTVLKYDFGKTVETSTCPSYPLVQSWALVLSIMPHGTYHTQFLWSIHNPIFHLSWRNPVRQILPYLYALKESLCFRDRKEASCNFWIVWHDTMNIVVIITLWTFHLRVKWNSWALCQLLYQCICDDRLGDGGQWQSSLWLLRWMPWLVLTV